MLKWFKSYALIAVGTFLVAVAFVFFISPNKIVPGGIYGIAIMLHHLLGTPIGLTALAFNIPLTLIGLKILGPRFGAKTVVAFVLTSVFVDTLILFSWFIATGSGRNAGFVHFRRFTYRNRSSFYI